MALNHYHDTSMLRDYLFLDPRRIRSYYQQIRAGAKYLKVEKASGWSASLSLGGPQAAGTEAVTFREPQLHEMVLDIEDHVRKKNLLTSLNNASYTHHEPVFFIEHEFQAIRAVIPIAEYSQLSGLCHLSVWISTNELTENSDRVVYLVEAVSEGEGDHAWTISGYTALDFLVRMLREETVAFRRTLLGSDDVPMGGDRSIAPFPEFGRDPISYLKRMGAQISQPRYIRSLFRVRLIFNDFHRGENVSGVVGYPVFVLDAGHLR